VRIYPHAMLMYASPAPGFEQLELHKYGFRMTWHPTTEDGECSRLACTDGWRPISMQDKMGWAKLGGCSRPPFTKELMRATFWCPPHPPEVEVTDDNVPYMQVYKQRQPDMYTHELREMTMFDLLDEHCETEHFSPHGVRGLASGARDTGKVWPFRLPVCATAHLAEHRAEQHPRAACTATCTPSIALPCTRGVIRTAVRWTRSSSKTDGQLACGSGRPPPWVEERSGPTRR